MKFNWKKFMDGTNDIVVHCETEREAIDFCKQMDKHGMKWCNNDSYLKMNNWEIYEEETCYSNSGSYAGLNFYKEGNYTILEWSDYMIKNPIDYLEYGYVVESEGGEFAIFMPTQNGDCFDYGDNEHCLMINNKDSYYYYNNELELEQHGFIECYDYSKYTIKRIYGYSNCPYKTTEISSKNRPLIWEREEVKKMTVSEICKELGYKVEIVEE